MRSSLLSKLIALAILTFVASSGLYAAPPVLSLTSYHRLSPYTKSGLGASATLFSGTIYLASKEMGNDYLQVSKSTDGTNLTNSELTSITLNYEPSITTSASGSVLLIAYTTKAGSIYITSSTNGSTFGTPVSVHVPSGTGKDLAATSGPTLVKFNGYLYAYWEVDYTDSLSEKQNQVQVARSNDNGSTWTYGVGPCAYAPTGNGFEAVSHASIGAAVYGSALYVGIQMGPNNAFHVCHSTSSTSGSDVNSTISSVSPGGGVSAAVYNGYLYFAFKNDTSSNYLAMTGFDGTSWISPDQTYSAVQINGTSSYQIAPALLAFDGQLYVFYTSNDNTHYLYQVHSY